jgi:hypothetical protein
MTSKSPFLLSFVAGVLSVVVIGASAFAFIFAWRYYRRRHKIEPSSREIPLTTLEDGRPRSTSDKLDSSPRSPSWLGGNSPSSAENADEAWEPLRQISAQTGTTNDAQNDGQRPFSVVSQSSAYIIYPVTTEVVDSEWVQDHPIRAKVIPDPTTSEDGNMSVEHDQPRPFISPSPPRMPPLPSAPPKPNARMSISTVWSQDSMWPPEKVPDVPVPPLAHFPVPRRVVFTPLMVPCFQNRRSIMSLPRSVGQSDFEEDF